MTGVCHHAHLFIEMGSCEHIFPQLASNCNSSDFSFPVAKNPGVKYHAQVQMKF
jgi:hypothetical protein